MFWILAAAVTAAAAVVIIGCVVGIDNVSGWSKSSPGAVTTATVTATATATATASDAPAATSAATPEGGLQFLDQVVRTGLTSARFAAESEKWTGAGYELTQLSGYGLGSADRYAAVWSASSSPARGTITSPGLSSAQYQADFDAMVARGYAPVLVDAWSTDAGEDRYAAVWKDPRGAPVPAFVARHGLAPEALQTEHQKWTARGYCVRCVSGYAAGDEARYTALWTEDCPSNATVLKYAATPGEYQTQLTEMAAAGYRTKAVNGYVVGNLAYYDTIYALGSGPDWSMVYGVEATAFQTKLEEMAKLGYKVTGLSAFTISGGFTYSAVWDR